MPFKIEFISLKGNFYSKNLRKKIHFRLVAPPNYRVSPHPFPVLLMNDGQDYHDMKLEKSLQKAFSDTKITPFVYVGIETDKDRMKDYGISSSADYKGRGKKAGAYTKFIIEEFIPFLKGEFNLSNNGLEWVFCGMSLGGLSAFDIVYNNPNHFGKAGVFSGSFWWRNKAYIKNDLLDRSRIILDVIKNGNYNQHLKFWLQCGTNDETADRNKNGIIDAIDDTLDVIKELKLKGYSKANDITYVEIKGGKHDLPTWGKAFPDFIKWAFSK